MGTPSVMASPLIERWLAALRGNKTPTQSATAVPTLVPLHLALNEAEVLRTSYPAEFPIAAAATERVVGRLGGVDLAPLARRSPSLNGYDWTSYLECSICRLVRFQRALREALPSGGAVLDFGSYFGNFGLVCRAMGFKVDAIDSYREYGAAMTPFVELQQEAGIRVHDFAAGDVTSQVEAGSFDAVICAGVIEHIPHTPRQLLSTLGTLLKPGGWLILDTPNLAYLYKRLTLLGGNSIFAPVEQQFFTELPFEGHHREYTVAEIQWMLQASGLDRKS